MANESPHRPLGKDDSRDDSGGGGGEQSPLQGRAPFLKNWRWEFIISLNQRACARGGAQHGKNSEAYEDARQEWEKAHEAERSLIETLDWLRSFHRKAPFLFFNGNTFAEVGRTLTDTLFADLPPSRRREAASLAAHYVAGVLDREFVESGVADLAQSFDFKPGDAVRTLKGSTHGIVRRILDDGRVVWRPAGTSSDLIALPESLLHRAKRRRK